MPDTAGPPRSHGTGHTGGFGGVPDDPEAARTDVDDAIRRSLQAIAGQWHAPDRAGSEDPGSSKRQLLAEARRRANRRATIAGVAAVVMLLAGGVAGVVRGIGTGGPRVVATTPGAARASTASQAGRLGSKCALVQVGSGTVHCAGVVVSIASRSEQRAAEYGAAAPLVPALGTSASGTAAVPSMASARPTDNAASAMPAAPSSSTVPSASSMLPEPLTSSPELVVLHVGGELRVTLPARSGVIWTYPMVEPPPSSSGSSSSGSSSSGSSISGSSSSGSSSSGSSSSGSSGSVFPGSEPGLSHAAASSQPSSVGSSGSAPSAVLLRVGGSSRAAGEPVTARFLARRPGTVVLEAWSGPVCEPAYAHCTTPQWQWQLTVQVRTAPGTR